MKVFLILTFTAILSTNYSPKKSFYTKKVNPFIGTGSTWTSLSWYHCSLWYGIGEPWVQPMQGCGSRAAAPFGMVQVNPDNALKVGGACSGYHHTDLTIPGFKHTHLSGTGAAAYGSHFDHKRIIRNLVSPKADGMINQIL